MALLPPHCRGRTDLGQALPGAIVVKLSHFRRWIAVGLLPAALLLRWGAFAAPGWVESVYSERVYPWWARGLGWINAWSPVPLAEVGALAGLVGASWLLWRRWRSSRQRGWRARLRAAAWMAWGGAGAVLLVFLLVWGLNYARPPLANRLGLDSGDISADQVLDLGEHFVAFTNATYAQLGADPAVPTRMPLDLSAADAALDTAYRRLALPGDPFDFATSPAKGLLTSGLFSRLGISGIFIPFTGEPLFNRSVPQASWPVAVAHEKAHQRGVTDEGEASLAAVLACLTADEPYLHYAAALYAGSALLSAATPYAPERAAEAAARWDAGPRQDLRAIRMFWERHRGRAMVAARRVNDAYLRSNRVEGGIQSYGRVVSMLVALQRDGRVPWPDAESEMETGVGLESPPRADEPSAQR